jgi:hypothetical protein
VDQQQRLALAPAYVVQFHAVDILPDWEQGTPAVLAVAGPHAIPVSTALRAGDRRVVLALGRRRDTLARLRDEPAVALCVMAAGAAFTAHGRATVIREELGTAPHVAAVAIAVETIQDHLEGSRTEMLGAVRWRWTEQEAIDDERRIVAELRALSGDGAA